MTSEQVELIFNENLDPSNWKVLSDTENELVILHKRGIRRVIKKERRNGEIK